MVISASISILVFLFLLITTVSATPITTTTLIHHELETTLRTLSNHGYNLFSNAITTSDIKFHLLSTTDSNFTIFAPRDGPVFDLDMTLDAIDYVSTLKYHVIPNHRLTFSDLRNLTSLFLDTLLPHYSVLIGKTRNEDLSMINGTNNEGVLVDGARVSDPDLFVGTSFVVHGIDGILSTGLNIRHQGFDDWLGSGDRFSQPAASPVSVSGMAPSPQDNRDVPVDVGVAPASQAGWNVPVGAPVVISVPKEASVGNNANDTRQQAPIGANVGNHVNETRQKTPIGADVGKPVNGTRQKTPIGANVGKPVNGTRQKTPIGANVGKPVNGTRQKMPIGGDVGKPVNETRQETPTGSNVGNVPLGKETRKVSPAGADKLKKKVHVKNKGRGRGHGHGHGHKRHRQQQPRNHDL